MPVTIDKLDIGVYIQYARSIQVVEQVKEQFQLDKASAIPPNTQLIDFAPKLAELELLMGMVYSRENPWAFFYPPPRFREQRKSPFARYRKSALLSTTEEEEELLAILDGVDCRTAEEEVDRDILKSAVRKRKAINDMIDDVINHIGMFVQG
jgi:hypothetical protein